MKKVAVGLGLSLLIPGAFLAISRIDPRPPPETVTFDVPLPDGGSVPVRMTVVRHVAPGIGWDRGSVLRAPSGEEVYCDERIRGGILEEDCR